MSFETIDSDENYDESQLQVDPDDDGDSITCDSANLAAENSEITLVGDEVLETQQGTKGQEESDRMVAVENTVAGDPNESTSHIRSQIPSSSDSQEVEEVTASPNPDMEDDEILTACMERGFAAFKFKNRSLSEFGKIFERKTDEMLMSFKNQLSKYKEKLKTVTAENEERKKELAELQKDFEESQRKQEIEIAELQRVNQETLKSIEKRKKEFLSVTARCTLLSDHGSGISVENDALREKVKAAKKMKLSVEREIDALRQKNELLMTKRNDLLKEKQTVSVKAKRGRPVKRKKTKLVQAKKRESIRLKKSESFKANIKALKSKNVNAKTVQEELSLLNRNYAQFFEFGVPQAVTLSSVKQEVPVTLSSIKQELPVNFSSFKHEVPVTLGTVKREIPVPFSLFTQEVPVTLSSVKPEVPVPVTFSSFKQEIPVTLTCIKQEIPDDQFCSPSLCQNTGNQADEVEFLGIRYVTRSVTKALAARAITTRGRFT